MENLSNLSTERTVLGFWGVPKESKKTALGGPLTGGHGGSPPPNTKKKNPRALRKKHLGQEVPRAVGIG